MAPSPETAPRTGVHTSPANGRAAVPETAKNAMIIRMITVTAAIPLIIAIYMYCKLITNNNL